MEKVDKTSPADVGAKNEMIATVWLLEQGYYVFRNVSPNGPVDIIAMKDGKTHFFDVKGTTDYKGKLSRPRISQKQKDLGIAVLRVSSGGCDIDWDPPLAAETALRMCIRCGKSFKHHAGISKDFCNATCRQRQYRIDNPNWRNAALHKRQAEEILNGYDAS